MYPRDITPESIGSLVVRAAAVNGFPGGLTAWNCALWQDGIVYVCSNVFACGAPSLRHLQLHREMFPQTWTALPSKPQPSPQL